MIHIDTNVMGSRRTRENRFPFGCFPRRFRQNKYYIVSIDACVESNRIVDDGKSSKLSAINSNPMVDGSIASMVRSPAYGRPLLILAYISTVNRCWWQWTCAVAGCVLCVFVCARVASIIKCVQSGSNEHAYGLLLHFYMIFGLQMKSRLFLLLKR